MSASKETKKNPKTVRSGTASVRQGRDDFDEFNPPPADQSRRRPMARTKSPLLIAVIVCLIIIALIIGLMRLFNGYWIWSSDVTREAVLVEQTVEAVQALMIVPAEEEPMVATIVDAVALQQEQPFYQDAQNGDQLLIYGSALKAILYSPARNIIVNVGPIQLPEAPPVTAPTGAEAAVEVESGVSENTAPEAVPPAAAVEDVLTVEIRNGSGVGGAAQTLAETLTAAGTYQVVAVTDAASETYTETLLVDQTTGDKDELIASLSETLATSPVGLLPADEADSVADVVIILGG